MTTGAMLWQPSAGAASRGRTSPNSRGARRAGAARVARLRVARGAGRPTSARRSGARSGTTAGVVGERGERTLVDPTTMPGARWFPDARLNFAENLLARRAADDAGDALVFPRRGQARPPRLARRARRDDVADGRGAEGAWVSRAGDRVAARTSRTCPRRSIAMLGATSLGAVLVVVLAGFRRAGCARPLRPDRAARALHRRRLLVQRQAAADPRQGRRDRRPSCRPSSASSSFPYLAATRDRARRISSRIRGARRVGCVRRRSARPRRSSTRGCRSTIRSTSCYSSGTTGVPKCIVHGAGGTLLQHLKEHLLHGDLKPGDRLFYFTTCGWMMWNWLASGARRRRDAAALRRLAVHRPRQGAVGLRRCRADDALRHVGQVHRPREEDRRRAAQGLRARRICGRCSRPGSPLAPESFDYVYQCVKDDLCLSSIAGGTDIVSCFALGCPTLPVWRGELQCRGLGMAVDVYDDDGKPIPPGTHSKGELVCTAPFPSMPVGVLERSRRREIPRRATSSAFPASGATATTSS